jgi:hypothetical protein
LTGTSHALCILHTTEPRQGCLLDVEASAIEHDTFLYLRTKFEEIPNNFDDFKLAFGWRRSRAGDER